MARIYNNPDWKEAFELSIPKRKFKSYIIEKQKKKEMKKKLKKDNEDNEKVSNENEIKKNEYINEKDEE